MTYASTLADGGAFTARLFPNQGLRQLREGKGLALTWTCSTKPFLGQGWMVQGAQAHSKMSAKLFKEKKKYS